jgi:hypothetical protein
MARAACEAPNSCQTARAGQRAATLPFGGRGALHDPPTRAPVVHGDMATPPPLPPHPCPCPCCSSPSRWANPCTPTGRAPAWSAWRPPSCQRRAGCIPSRPPGPVHQGWGAGQPAPRPLRATNVLTPWHPPAHAQACWHPTLVATARQAATRPSKCCPWSPAQARSWAPLPDRGRSDLARRGMQAQQRGSLRQRPRPPRAPRECGRATRWRRPRRAHARR